MQETKSKKRKKSSGITLVALVVTIVILIILAVISINVAFGENGIIKQAEETKTYYSNEEAYDKELIGKLDNEVKENFSPSNKYVDNELITSPKIAEGMIPVYWNGNNWVKTTIEDSKWYNYSNKEWANVVLEDSTFNGDILDESKSYSQLVWIPRFAYKITSGWHSTKTGTIDVIFVGTNNRGKDGTLYNGTYAEATSGITSGSTMKNYVVEPAFDYGDKKLEGFWIGKFESSHTGCTTNKTTGEVAFTGNEVMQIKANVTSWRSMTIGNVFDVCLDMNKEGNPYGLNTNNNVVDPHMIKNTEWGAVAYLSKSKYGKETEEIFINNSSDRITGNAGTTESAISEPGVINAYHTVAGQKASTTGNIYGVYDMSGGSWDRVVNYLDNGHDNLKTYGKNMIEAENKYKEVYEQGVTDEQLLNYEKAATKYGDAIYETGNGYANSNASWYNDYTSFVRNNYTFLVRGGDCDEEMKAGIFGYGVTIGGINLDFGFRIAIPVI